MNKKKICFIAALLITGGSDKLLLAQSSILIKKGFEVVLYSIHPVNRNSLYKEFLEKGVCIKDYSKFIKYFLNFIKYIMIPPVYVILNMYNKLNGLNPIDIKDKIHIVIENRIIFRICEVILFFRILIDSIRFKYDIISSLHYDTMRITYILKKILRITTIYTEISSPKWRRCKINKSECKYLNFFDEIIVPSKLIGEELTRYEGLNKEYMVLPFFVELPNYDFEIINKKAESFGVIARLSKEKNQHVLIKVLKLLIDQKRNARLILVGTGSEGKYYKNLAADLGVGNNVCFIPFFNDITEVINKIDIFVLCSDVEGMSLSLIEALYFGKPILATDVGANSELVIDGFNGFLVNRSDITNIAKKIILIMDDGDLFKKFSENSKKLYDIKFNPDSLSQKLLEIYNI